ncbi:MAG: excinuclease ABC subunit UvrA [Cyanobacterium sp. T60_A2020_053]|nr:excinuclease ABC subunit UvrA [Cyanobacterium sp. T60_A2020_053]
MSMSDKIIIKGARQHNLKNIDLELPRNQLIVFTGVSGSGKSSLAFDTIFAEGQRRYVESLSAYARQFLGQLDKPDVDSIEGLSPAISIDQKSTSHNPRSTVGTVTEIYDYLRLLYGRAGIPHCPICDHSIAPQTIDEMCDRILALPEKTKIHLLAPVIRGKKGNHQQLLSSLRSQGFVRVKINGEIRELADNIQLKAQQKHDISVLVDRLMVKFTIQERLADSLSTCLKIAEGIAIVEVLDHQSEAEGALDDVSRKGAEAQRKGAEVVFSENFACPIHGAVMEELSPRLFSFNSPYGACLSCHGLGSFKQFSPHLIIPNPQAPVTVAIAPWVEKENPYYLSLLQYVAKEYNFKLSAKWSSLTPQQQQIILYGDQQIQNLQHGYYRGVIPMLEKTYAESNSDIIKQKLEQYLEEQICETCHGKRLKPEALSVRLGQYTIDQLSSAPLRDCLTKINNIKLTPKQAQIGDLALREIKARLQFLLDVGLDYLTLDRPAMTLSGGEAQRIRLATQIGSGLTGVLYVLDEPSIGLHQRDNDRLLATLKKLRDLDNTLIVVEHDEDTMKGADHIVDIGPLAGVHGGTIVVQGTLQEVMACEDSVTGAYLSGRRKIDIPTTRREGNGKFLTLQNCHRNNLKNIDVEIPLGKLVCITGVSGSGKSTLVNDLLYPALQHYLNRNVPFPKQLGALEGIEAIDKVIVIDQSPIGRTPRSNPATYTGLFDVIRELFTHTVEAKARGYKAGRFSFNVKGGRCEACMGQGVNVISMNFLPDVYVQCDVCKGARYNRETLQVQYKGYSIADVLDMTVEEALQVFENIPRAVSRLQTLMDVGLNYVKLGQSAPTLSGGEAQRVKLASELSKRATGKTIYLIDEPTTGLSFYDVHHLLNVLQKLTDKGNSMVIIEHNLDVVKGADWIIDLGPEGGNNGGEIVAFGTPETIAKSQTSYLAKYLKHLL